MSDVEILRRRQVLLSRMAECMDDLKRAMGTDDIAFRVIVRKGDFAFDCHQGDWEQEMGEVKA